MKKYFLLIILVLIAIFLGREFFRFKNMDFQIFAEKDYLLIKSESGKIWGYGNLNSPGVKNLSQNITSYFSREKIRDIYDLEEKKEYIDENIKLQKISRNLAYVGFKNQSFLFFAENFDDADREKLIQSSLSLKVDWHIMNKNIVLDFLPQPKQGVLYISNNNPRTKIREKFRENNIPLISTRKTGGFSLKFIENKWSFLARN